MAVPEADGFEPEKITAALVVPVIICVNPVGNL
jgi:hypothetical protein